MQSGVLYVIYIIVFAGAFLGMQTLIGAGRQATVRVKMANSRMKRLHAEDSQIAMIDKARRSQKLNADGEFAVVVRWLNKLLVQGGIDVHPRWVFLGILAATLVAPTLCFFISQKVYMTVGLVFAAPVISIYGLSFWAKRRRDKIGSQLPEALDVIIRSLGAGHPVPVAMNMVAREMADPIGSEIGIATDEITYGSGLGVAVQRMAERVGHLDLELFAATVRLQERTGGNLAELLRSNAQTIRERQRMRLKIKAASAEGRMSALILNVAPIVLYLTIEIMAPEFYGAVDDSPLLNIGFAGAIVWMLIGNLVMRKMIAFRI